VGGRRPAPEQRCPRRGARPAPAPAGPPPRPRRVLRPDRGSAAGGRMPSARASYR
jgi:hypothetical protein